MGPNATDNEDEVSIFWLMMHTKDQLLLQYSLESSLTNCNSPNCLDGYIY